MLFIMPPSFYILNEDASPPLQFEPFFQFDNVDFLHLKRGMSLNAIPITDCYGISSYTEDIEVSRIIAKFLKQRDPQCKVILGGYHTLSNNLYDDCFDYVVIGFGEEWVKKFVVGEYPEARILYGSYRLIDWGIESYEFYQKYNPHFHRGMNNAYSIRTTYGCFWNCSFCLNRFKKVIYKSWDNISFQLHYLAEKGIKSIRVIDEIFTFHPQFELIVELLGRLNFEWTAQDRISSLTKEKVSFLKQNNCRLIQTGVESLNNDILIKLQKEITVDEIKAKVKMCQDLGLSLSPYFMLGLPFDTIDTIQQTRDLALQLFDPGLLRPDIYIPLPGSLIGDNPEKFGVRFLTKEFRYFSPFCFQNIHGRLVSIPGNIDDIDKWEQILRNTLYNLSPPLIKNILKNPITTWYDDLMFTP